MTDGISFLMPTVGRIVHVYTSHRDDKVHEGPFAAIVTGVPDNGTAIHVTVFYPSGQPVRMFIEHEATREAPYMPYWVWPPR